MFGDWDWLTDRVEVQDRNYHNFLSKIKEDDKIVVIEIGAGFGVPTIRQISESVLENKKFKYCSN